MTRRRSRREIARAVEELGADAVNAPQTPEEAATAAVRLAGRADDLALAFHFEYEAGTAEVPEEYLAVGEGQSFVWFTPEEYVSEEFRDDLPARLPSDLSIQFAEVDT